MIRRTEPTRGLLQGGRYTNADHTDIRRTFARVREQMLDFTSAYRMLSHHYPTSYALKRAAEIALRKTK